MNRGATCNINGDDISARITVKKKGQCTWGRPSDGRRCVACAHYSDAKITRGKNKGLGRCGLVKIHTKKVGVPFDGKSAFSCAMFRPQQ